jgi:hypothetical protein
MTEITQYLSLWNWLISLNRMVSSPTHFQASDTVSFFLWLGKTQLCTYTTHPLTAPRLVPCLAAVTSAMGVPVASRLWFFCVRTREWYSGITQVPFQSQEGLPQWLH